MKNIHHLFKSMHIACLPLMHPSDITIAIIILQSKKTKYSKFEIVQVNIQIKTGTRPKIDIDSKWNTTRELRSEEVCSLSFQTEPFLRARLRGLGVFLAALRVRPFLSHLQVEATAKTNCASADMTLFVVRNVIFLHAREFHRTLSEVVYRVSPGR